MKKNIIRIVFIIASIAQLAFISYLIINSISISNKSTLIKLQCRPVDPYDFMKGRYAQLAFESDNIDISKLSSKPQIEIDKLYKYINEPVYCILAKENDLYEIEDISFEKPAKGTLFIRARVRDAYENKLSFDFDFDKYYMQEDAALKIEQLLLNPEMFKKLEPILVLAVDENGNSVQKELLVNGIKIEEFIKKGPEYTGKK
jgi:uncharacterized membrane-anchored protein